MMNYTRFGLGPLVWAFEIGFASLQSFGACWRSSKYADSIQRYDAHRELYSWRNPCVFMSRNFYCFVLCIFSISFFLLNHSILMNDSHSNLIFICTKMVVTLGDFLVSCKLKMGLCVSLWMEKAIRCRRNFRTFARNVSWTSHKNLVHLRSVIQWFFCRWSSKIRSIFVFDHMSTALLIDTKTKSKRHRVSKHTHTHKMWRAVYLLKLQ